MAQEKGRCPLLYTSNDQVAVSAITLDMLDFGQFIGSIWQSILFLGGGNSLQILSLAHYTVILLTDLHRSHRQELSIKTDLGRKKNPTKNWRRQQKNISKNRGKRTFIRNYREGDESERTWGVWSNWVTQAVYKKETGTNRCETDVTTSAVPRFGGFFEIVKAAFPTFLRLFKGFWDGVRLQVVKAKS